MTLRENTTVKDCGLGKAAMMPGGWRKRGFDLACVFLALPLWGPLMLAIAVLIRVSSRGPVFFRQERVGFLGGRFTCFKFRTMKPGADTAVHARHLQELMSSDRPMIKMDNSGDRRLIPMGRLLRASGLDELPQLFNVLRGDMSLVGPRPCIPYEYDQYLPWQKRRFEALPGLTGLWQVSGKNKTTFNEMIRLDIHYANHQSLGLDLKIMWKTFATLAEQIKDARRRPAARRATTSFAGPSPWESRPAEPHGVERTLVNS